MKSKCLGSGPSVRFIQLLNSFSYGVGDNTIKLNVIKNTLYKVILHYLEMGFIFSDTVH